MKQHMERKNFKFSKIIKENACALFMTLETEHGSMTQQTVKGLLRIWGKKITMEEIINTPQGVVITWKLPLQICLSLFETK